MNEIPRQQFSLAMAIVAIGSLVTFAQEPGSTDKHSPTEHAYLGVHVSAVHPALSANLKDVLKPEQGLTVDDVAEKSAAEKSGIKLHDVLTAYDDQKLFSPDQLAKLILGDKPGRKVNFEVLRHGKLQQIPVVLGQRDSGDARAWSPSNRSQPYRFGAPDNVPRRFQSRPLPAAEWENFDSLTIKRTAPDKMHVEIQHRESDGQVHKHVFEGTREEIHKEVNAAKNMKAAEKGHLLRALNLYDPGNAAPFPHIWFEPGIGWLFEQPGGPFH